MTPVIDCNKLLAFSGAQYTVIMKQGFSSLGFAVKLSSIMLVLPLVVAEKVDGGGSAHGVVSPGL